jgi:hypothetical protein
MPVEILTKEDLSKFKTELVTEIKQVFSLSPAVTKQKEFLKSKEVMKMLSISPGTLQNLRINGTMPFTKIGGVIYYAYDDIKKLFETNKRKPY